MKRRANSMEWFVRQVAEGDSALDAKNISLMSEQLGLHLDKNRYFCAVVQYTNPDINIKNVHFPIALYNACVDACKVVKNDVYCYSGSNFYTVMIISDHLNDRVRVVESLYSYISSHVSESIQMGVGRSINNLEKLSYSRVEAYEALRNLNYQINISYVEDVYVTRNITTRKVERDKNKIIELFKNDEIEEMKPYMHGLIENVREESPVRDGVPYPTSIRRTVAEILTEIMHIGSDAGIEVEKLFNYEDPYSRIVLMDDTPKIVAYFFDIVQRISDAIGQANQKIEKNMLVLAKQCIDNHISDPELSLSLVSENLGITSTYFSAFFIREVGIGFNEYINGIRIEKAKAMLLNTNKKISEIASECGFRSSSYFIVVFKKQVGMSPGMYRNKKN